MREDGKLDRRHHEKHEQLECRSQPGQQQKQPASLPFTVA
jgi:hypothetical protein